MTLRCLSKYLIALAVPAILLTSGSAHAAKRLDISNGFLTAKSTTSVGFDFSLGAEGTIEFSSTNYDGTFDTSIELDCSVDEVAESFHCDGVMYFNGNPRDIRLGFSPANQIGYWSIDANATPAQQAAFESWGSETYPHFVYVPYGWSYMNVYTGIGWIQWWYSSSWAETFENITGCQYGEQVIC